VSLPTARDPLLEAVDLAGRRRHPARVIDELMGHQRSRRGDLDGGSRIGARCRHTTDAMAIRVAGSI
jgi:hypothetical protein